MANIPSSDDQELADQINKLVEQLTSSRGEALANARSLQMAGQGLIQREELRLSRKLGKDHPRVQQLRQRRESMLGNIQRLSAEKQISEIRPPEVQENEALVHGRVLDERAQGIPGLQVTLVDKNGRPLLKITATTNSSGYYALKVGPDQFPADQSALLSVKTVTGREVHRAEKPVEIKFGSQTTLEVQLNRRDLASQGQPTNGPGQQPGQNKAWTIVGTVTDQAGIAMAGLTIEVTSPDIKLEGPLGSATTTRTGKYRVSIKPDREIEGLKQGLNLIVSLIDPKGQSLYSSREEILFKPGEELQHDIQVSPPGRKTKAR
jgi:hypothetical protein